MTTFEDRLVFMFSAHNAKNVISCTPNVSKLVNFHEQ